MELSVGRVELIIGPMFAGKTTELLRRIERAKLARRRCVVMKYQGDTRYSEDAVATHDLATHVAIPCDRLMDHFERCLDYDTVGVDEGQFYPDVVEFAEGLSERGKTVIVAGLDGDFRRRPFGRILELISRSESLTKLSAVCTVTGGEASFTQRLTESRELEVVGGADIYTAASRSTFFKIATTGEVHVTMGPVRSGKTTELMRVLNRHFLARRRPVLLRSPLGSTIAAAKYPVVTADHLPPPEELAAFDTIGIDEAHRFAGIAAWADALANTGRLVEVSCLGGTYEHEPYPSIVELVSVAERVQKLDSVCALTGAPAAWFGINVCADAVQKPRFLSNRHSFHGESGRPSDSLPA
jgi:thymidine kinase